MSQLLTNKYLLIVLGFIAVIGLLFIGYSASQNATSPVSTPSQQTLQPKSATLPPPVKDHPVSGQIIVNFKPQYTQTQINEHLQLYHASIIRTIEGINQTVVKVPAGQEETIMQKLQTDGYAQTAQRDYTTHAFFVPNDPAFSLQYALNNTGQSIQGKVGKAHADLNIESAWDVTQGNGVKVAILDTGINLNHPDLAGKVVLQKSFVSNTVEDGNGHGTHVAGIIAADTNNSAGVAGTCPKCQLIIGKILDDSGSGTTSNATAGITWAADQGAKVINMSLGTTETTTESLYAQAVSYAMSKGAVVVAAAGNDGTSELNYPAAAPNVISVAATTNTDQKASYSNFGSYVQITAPGDNILSTGPTHSFQLQPFGYTFSTPYMYLSGTSMATPYVSGVAALVASTQFGTTAQAVINRLYATADKISGTGTYWKNGRVNAALAVGPAAPTATTVPQPTSITPTLYCVGGNGTPPCATIAAGITTTPPQTGGGNPSVSITGSASGGGISPSSAVSPTSGSNINPSISPAPSGTPNNTGTNICSVNAGQLITNIIKQNTSAAAQGGKTHIKCEPGQGKQGGGTSGGQLSQLFKLLLQLLLQLLQQIIGCLQQQPSNGGTPTPSVSPAQVSVSPSPSVSSSPSVNSPSPVTGNGNPTATPKPATTATPTTPVTSANCTNPTHTIQIDTNNAHNGITLGNYFVDTDTWNYVSGMTQTVYVCNYNNWYVATGNIAEAGGVKSYPNVHEDFNNVPISSFKSVTSTFASTSPRMGIYNAAYDIWINNYNIELMIWNESYNQTLNGLNPSGSVQDTVTFGGVTYDVYKSGNYIALKAKTPFDSGTLDLLSIFKYITSKGWIASNATLSQIDYGIEFVSTNNQNATFKLTNFSVTAN